MRAEDEHPRSGPRLDIEIWSDVLCPYCALGHAAFDEAVSGFAGRVNVRHRSFLLLPQLMSSHPVPLYDFLASMLDTDRAQAAAMYEPLRTRGLELGVPFQFDRALVVDSRPAHRLRLHAATRNRGTQVVHALSRSYFVEGRNIADARVLREIAMEIGLDPDAAAFALSDPTVDAALSFDLEEAARLGISGVPFFVLAGQYSIAGAQPVNAFRSALATAWSTIT